MDGRKIPMTGYKMINNAGALKRFAFSDGTPLTKAIHVLQATTFH